MLTNTNKVAADEKIEAAREKVREWGARISQGEWDWHLLGHALEFAHQAMEENREYQRPWTILADIYHRIGKLELANKCLEKSYATATPGPRFPGGFYKEVKGNINSGYPFNSAGGLKRVLPPDWFEQKYQKYWKLQ